MIPASGGVPAILVRLPRAYVNVREQPSTYSRALGNLTQGARVTAFPDAVQNGHIYIIASAIKGWVSLQNGAVVFEKAEVQQPAPALRLSWPTTVNHIIQPFGVNHVGLPDFYTRWGLPAHEGIDFAAPRGTAIFACADGVVTRVARQPDGPYGIQVRIEHHVDGIVYETCYAHLESVRPGLKPGDRVQRREEIGKADSTGNSFGHHLHLTLKQRGATRLGLKQTLGSGKRVTYPSDIIDPTPYLDPFQ